MGTAHIQKKKGNRNKGSAPKHGRRQSTVDDAGIEIVTAPALKELSWLIHGFSTRPGGHSTVYGGKSLNLGFTKEDSRSIVEANRTAFLKKLGALGQGGSLLPLVSLRQVHSDIIHRVSKLPEYALTGDGLVTSTPGLLLAILTADCVPVILVDPRSRSVGVFHAGWRGTVKRIVEKGVGEMRRWFGALPRNILAAVGPGVHSCCYEVGEEVRTKFGSQFSYAANLFRETKSSDVVRDKYPLLFLTARAPGHSELPSKLFLDLIEANRQQLLAAGVLAKNIYSTGLCTSSRPEFLFSYRADRGKTGRLMGVVGIRT